MVFLNKVFNHRPILFFWIVLLLLHQLLSGLGCASRSCIAGDCHNGIGTVTYADQDNNRFEYSGSFSEGLFNGTGKLTQRSPSGVTIEYSGSFVKGAYEGSGNLTYNDSAGNSTSFTGVFSQGKRNGMGALTNPDGSIKRGLWEDDRFIESLACPHCGKSIHPQNTTCPFCKKNIQTATIEQKNPVEKKTVFLHDGSKLIGEIIAQTVNSITVKTKYITRTVNRNQIKSIE